MSCGKYLILSDILLLIFEYTELLHIQVLFFVIPLHLDHRLIRLLLAATFLNYAEDSTNYGALLGFTE